MAKIYVISDKPELCIMASNMINASGNSAIISELSSFSEEAVFKDIKENISSYDFFLVFKGGATVAAAHAGRVSGLVATACRDSEDVDDIMSDGGVNGIFIDPKLGKAGVSDIIDEILRNVGGKRTAKAQEPVPRAQVEYKPAKQQGTGGFLSSLGITPPKIGGEKSKRVEEKPAKKYVPDSNPQGSFVKAVKSKGISKAMKDALGIKDEGGN